MVAEKVGEARTRWSRATAASAPSRAAARGSAARTGATRASRSTRWAAPLMMIFLRFALLERRRLIIIKAILLVTHPILILALPVLIIIDADSLRVVEVAEDVGR